MPPPDKELVRCHHRNGRGDEDPGDKPHSCEHSEADIENGEEQCVEGAKDEACRPCVRDPDTVGQAVEQRVIDERGNEECRKQREERDTGDERGDGG